MAPLIAAVLITNSISNASTGGLNAQAGNAEDSSYSSVSEQTYVTDAGGTSTVTIETDDNGQVNTQTITKPVVPGAPVEIDIATSTGTGSVHVGVRSFTGSKGSSVSSTSLRGVHSFSSPSSSSIASSSGTHLPAAGFSLQLQTIWRSFFNLFRFF